MFFTLQELRLFDKQKWLNFFLLSSLLIFSRLPACFEGVEQIIVGNTILILWFGGILFNFLRVKTKTKLYAALKPQKSNVIYWITGIYLFIPIGYSIVHYDIGIYKILSRLFIIPLSIVLLLSIFSNNYSEEGKQFILKGLLNSIIVYVAFNMLLLPFVGFRYLGNNITFEKIGLVIPRISFWLNTGIDKVSSLLMIGFISSVIWYKQYFAKFSILLLGVTIVLFDSRSIYVFLLILLPLLVLIKKNHSNRKLSKLKWLFLIPAILPFFLYTIYPLLRQIAFLKERGGLLRIELWEYTITYFINSSFINQMFGYGYKGYLYSGLSSDLREIVHMGKMVTPHSMTLIHLVDIGLIGCTLIFCCLYKTFQRLTESNISSVLESENRLFSLIGLIAISSIGSLASIGTYYTIEVSIILLSLVMFSNISFRVKPTLSKG